jgi:hypothetical protein|nr:MAG TPA: minor tail protein [Caudoviricetes sp.]
MSASGYDGSLKFDTKIVTDGFRTGMKTLKQALTAFKNSLFKVGNQIDFTFDKSSKVINLENQIARTEKKIKNLSAELTKLGNAKIPTDMYTWYNKQIDITAAKLERLLERKYKMQDLGANVNSNSFKSLEYDIANLTEQLRTYRNEKEQLVNSEKAFTSGEDSESYRKKVEELDKLSDQLDVYRQRLAETKQETSDSTNKTNVFTNALKATGRAMSFVSKKAVQALGAVARIAKNAFLAATRAAVNFGKYLGGKLVSKVQNLVNHLKQLNKSGSIAGKGILRLSNMFKLLLIRMAMRAAIQGIRDGFKNLVQYSEDVNQTLSGLMSSMTYLKNSFAAAFAPILSIVAPILNTLINILATAIGYVNQFFSALGGKSTFIRAKKVNEDYAKSLKGTGGAAKQAGKEAKKALAPFDELIQIQLDENKASGGSGNAGGSSAPNPADMFETVEISKGISDFANRLKELFKAGDWNGLGQFLGNTINDAVSKFTDFIKWDSIGGKISGFVTAFTTTFNSLIRTIKWENIGAALGEGINTISNTLYLLLTQIQWRELGQALGRGLNSLVTTVDWGLFGATIGAYFQAKISALLGFVETVQWGEIGKAISDAITGLINEINWAELGLLFATSFNGLFQMLDDFVTNFDWTDFGSKLSTSIGTFFQNFEWASAGTTVADIINGLLDAILAFDFPSNWDKFATGLATSLSNFYQKLEWEKIGTVINDIVSGFLKGLISFVQKTDWSSFGNGILTVLSKINWLGIASQLATLFGSALGSAFGVLAKVLGTLVSNGVTGAKQYFQKKIEECGGNIWAGILKGITDAVVGIANWVYDNAVKPFIEAFKNALGIHSPSTVMAEMGKDIWDGFCKGIKDFFTAPVEFIKQYMTDPFIKGVKDLLGIQGPSKVLNSIGEFVVKGFNQGISNSQPTTQPIIQSWAKGVSSWFSSILGLNSNESRESKQWADNTINSFNTETKGKYKTSQNPIESWAKGIRDWFIGSSNSKGVNKESWIKFAGDVIAGFKSKTTSSNTETKSPIESWAKGIRDWFLGSGNSKGVNKESWSKFASDTITGFKEKVSSSHNEVQNNVELWAENIRKWFVGDKDSKGVNKESWTKFASYIIDAFKSKISTSYTDTQNVMQDWAKNVATWFYGNSDITSDNGLYSTFKNIAKRVNEGFAAGISAFAHLAKSAISSWASDLVNEAKDELDIHSPSREFKSIAEYVVKGFNAGLADMANTSKSEAMKWLESITDVFNGVDIKVPVGLNIPNATSYIPNVAKGFVIPPHAGFIESLRSGRFDNEELLTRLANNIDFGQSNKEPRQIVLKFEGSLGNIARILKPELDKESSRQGVNLIVTGGM